MWSGGMQEGGVDTSDTRIYRHITTWHQHEVAPPPAGPGRAVAWWSTVESLSWCLEAPFAGTSTLHAISDQNAPMQSSSGTTGGAGGGARRRAPAASARRAGPGIAHAPRPLCSGRRFIPTQHGLTTVSLRLHQGRGVNCSHITLLLTASAAGDQPRRHVQKEVIPLPNDRTARSRSPSHVMCVIVRQR